MTPIPVDALVFDLGGVIVGHDNAVLYRRLASRCRSPEWQVEQVRAAVADPRWGTGAPVADLHDELRREAGYDGDWPTFAEDWCCHLWVDPSMLAFVEALAARRRVMIFSNTNPVHWDFLVAASDGRLGAFERHLSYEIGHEKPSLRSFQIVAETAGLRPEAMLFFDDVAANVEGARRAGFQAELFTGEAALRARLAARGLALA